jgi:hypothetical protein
VLTFLRDKLIVFIGIGYFVVEGKKCLIFGFVSILFHSLHKKTLTFFMEKPLPLLSSFLLSSPSASRKVTNLFVLLPPSMEFIMAYSLSLQIETSSSSLR